MPWARHRIPLVTAALFDAAGLIVLALALTRGLHGEVQGLEDHRGSLLALILIYCSLGWLFGSYTLLKLRKLSWMQVLARLSTTAFASMITAAAYSFIFRLQITNTLFFRGSLIPLFLLLGVWSGFVRLFLRRHWPEKELPRWHILAVKDEIKGIQEEWLSSQTKEPLPSITDIQPNYSPEVDMPSEALALSAGVINGSTVVTFCQEAISRGIPVHSLVELAEQELQRIPPRWVDNQWLLFSGGIDGQRTSIQKQLKRYADVLASIALLLLTSPLLLLAAILVKLQDGGSILYKQKRSGLIGKEFDVLKIRTMSTDAEKHGAQWAQTDDKRITPVGYWLRKTRLDELPQLINVLRGEMSLIGPRPERPSLEQTLEAKIPNYRLRHWMRPGLSGWAQVNMPYASSVEDSEMKLSYDLFYLRNATIWLDLLIMFKTIKIVLKGSGR